jgi:hypothetical protein
VLVHLRILFDFVPTPIMFLAALVVLALLGMTLWRGRHWGRPGALALGVLALAWIPVNRPVEGAVLLRLADDMGVTVADLLTVALGTVAAYRFCFASASQQPESSSVSAERLM